ncbi:MAG: phosphatase PAP2 family protein [Adhaeribacter sp.]
MKILAILLSLLPSLSWAQPTSSLPQSRLSFAMPPTKASANGGINTKPWPVSGAIPADSVPVVAGQAKKVYLRQLAIPVSLLAAGFAGSGKEPLLKYNAEVQEEIQEHYRGFHTKMDDYSRHVPIVIAYALNLAGIKGRHDLINLSALFLLSDFINSSATSHLKKLTRQLRPDHTSKDAFPSGHTSAAFTGATILYLEFPDHGIWYGVGGYSIAAATGGLRLLNNKHWLSDVLAGAGIGILSTRAAYALYPWIQKKISQGLPKASGQQLLLLPSYTFKTPGICVVYDFN